MNKEGHLLLFTWSGWRALQQFGSFQQFFPPPLHKYCNGQSLSNTYKSNIHTFYCSTWIPTLWAAPLVSSSLAIFVFIPITRGRDPSTTFFLAMIENSQRFISRGFYQLSWSKNMESPCRRKSTKVYTFWKETKRKGKTKTFISQTINLLCVHVTCTATSS